MYSNSDFPYAFKSSTVFIAFSKVSTINSLSFLHSSTRFSHSFTLLGFCLKWASFNKNGLLSNKFSSLNSLIFKSRF